MIGSGERPAAAAGAERGARPPAAGAAPRAGTARPRLAAALSLAVVAAAFVHALLPSWRRWGSLYMDVGRELELPRQLLAGARLYADVRAYYGPLAYWVNEGLYAAFGVHADVLAGAGLVTAALYAVLAWWLARAFVGEAGAALLAAVVVEVCLFPHLNFNPSFTFVLPYAFAATYGALGLLATTLLLARHARTGRAAPFALAAAALGLVALTKVELLAAALAAHAAFAVAAGAGRLRRLHLAGWGLALLLPAATYGALAWRDGAALWTDSLGANFAGGAGAFFRRTAGLEAPAASLAAAGASALALLATLALAAGAARLARRPGLGSGAGWAVPALGAGAAALGWALLPFEHALRALPAALALALAWAAAEARREPARRAALVPEVVVLAAGLASLARLGLATGPQNYGFYLLPPGLLALGVVALGRLPARLAPPGPGRRAAAAVAAGMLAGLAWPVQQLSRDLYAQHTAVLEVPRGRFLVVPDEALTLVPLLAALPAATPTIAIPGGAGWVWASGQPWADGTHAYLPVDLVGSYDDAGTVRRWSARPPELVVWLDARIGSAAEFGREAIGVDHGHGIKAFLLSRYRVVVPPTPEAPYTVLRLRREAGLPRPPGNR